MRHHIQLYLVSTLVALLIPLTIKAQPYQPSESVPTRVASLLTCGPSDLAPFMLYGHSAIRIRNTVDPTEDYVFNYGLFSFEQSHFLLNFALGKPLYSLGVSATQDFISAYKYEGRSLTEQVLNLTDSEVERMYEFLRWNSLPANRDYIYNFYFDNCSTKPRDLIERFSNGLVIADQGTLPTFRNILGAYTKTDRWYTFLCELPLGSQTDRPMTVREAAFLPLMLETELDHASRADNAQPIVRLKTQILSETRAVGTRPDLPISPTGAILILLLIYALLVLLSHRLPHLLMCYRSLLFLTIGVCGVILWFLGLISHHPHTFPNLNMLLFTPIYLLLTVTIWMHRCQRLNNWLYFINFVGILTCVAGTTMGLQTLPEGISLLFGLVCVDHAIYSGVVRYLKDKRE